MVGCSVANCRNHSKYTKNVIYHVFPKSLSVNDVWVLKCNRTDTFNVHTGRVCSDHFAESDYVDDMKNRLLGLPQRRLLKDDAVPTLNLGRGVATSLLTTSCSRYDVMWPVTCDLLDLHVIL
ncbi:hypothetical protein J6590_066690 [Homalodisca vitripennis]|nr:hypothetical protein J6590_066690 [Homalodisca vitripennis]